MMQGGVALFVEQKLKCRERGPPQKARGKVPEKARFSEGKGAGTGA